MRKHIPSELLERYASGADTITQLARKCGVDRMTFAARLRERGIPILNATETKRRMWLAGGELRERISRGHLAANRLTRGAPSPVERHEQRARTLASRGTSNRSIVEPAIAGAFRVRGVRVDPQMPLGAYNVDVALPDQRIAIEVEASHWSPGYIRQRGLLQRTDRLLAEGWSVVYVVHLGRRRQLALGPLAEAVLAPSEQRVRVLTGSGDPAPAKWQLLTPR